MHVTNRYKLIVLDADAAVLRDVAEAVSPHYDAVKVRDAQVALNLCDEDPLVRVIVTEHVIHGPTGQSLLELVRLRHAHVRRVMLTTYADLSVIVAGLHTGAIQYLAHKPIVRGELLTVLGQPATTCVVSPPAAQTRPRLSA